MMFGARPSSRKFRGRRNPRIRQLAMAVLDSALLRGFIAKWAYRWGWHGDLKVTTHTICLLSETPLPAPLTLAFASDFHAGPTTHPEVYARLAQELTDHRPDVVLLGGDFVSRRAEYVAPLLRSLATYRPPLGRFAVLGNHDLWTDDEEDLPPIDSCGVEVLVNRNVALAPPFDCVSICGIDDPWTGEADSAKAFDGAGAIRIWLTHSPDGLLLLGDQKYAVAFAGHTHGGQICMRDGTPLVGAAGPLSRSHSRDGLTFPGMGADRQPRSRLQQSAGEDQCRPGIDHL